MCFVVYVRVRFTKFSNQDKYTGILTINALGADVLSLLDDLVLKGWGISVGADRLRLLNAAKNFGKK